jgi:adenine deaminase
VAKGMDVFKVLQVACINPVHHYKMNVGLLRENDAADFIVVEDLTDFKVLQTYIDGELVAENGQFFVKHVLLKPQIIQASMQSKLATLKFWNSLKNQSY